MDLSGDAFGFLAGVAIPSDALGPTPKKRKTSRGESSIDNVPSAVKARAKKKITFAQKCEAVARGCKCSICSLTDSSPDPTDPTKRRLWGSYKVYGAPGGKEAIAIELSVRHITDGSECQYCLRTFHAKYHTKYGSLKNYKIALGTDRALHEESSRYTGWYMEEIAKFVELGGEREEMSQVKWPSPIELKHLTIFEMAWHMPEDEFIEAKNYKFGDVRTNGRGDIETKGPGGIALIKLFKEKIWKKTAKMMSQAVMEQSLMNTGDVDQSSLQSNFEALQQNIAGGVALPISSHSAAGSSSSSAPWTGSSNPAAPLGLQFPSPALAPPPVQADAAVSQERSTPVPKRGRTGGGPKPKNPSGVHPLGSTKKGRPAKDSSTMLRSAMAQLGDANESSLKFFGDDWKNVRRNWEYYLKGVEDMINDEDSDMSATMKEQIEYLHKQASSAKNILSVVMIKGLTSDATIVAYESELVWLSRGESPVADPMPFFFQDLMIGVGAAKAWPANHFWEKIQDSRLASTQALPQAAIGVKQSGYASEKIQIILGEAKYADKRKSLISLCEALVDAKESKYVSDETLCTEVKHLHLLCACPIFPKEYQTDVKSPSTQNDGQNDQAETAGPAHEWERALAIYQKVTD